MQGLHWTVVAGGWCVLRRTVVWAVEDAVLVLDRGWVGVLDRYWWCCDSSSEVLRLCESLLAAVSLLGTVAVGSELSSVLDQLWVV